MRPLQRFLAFVPAVLFPTAVLSAQAGSSVDRAGWLAGCWELRAPNRVTMEMWMPPLGGQMLGASRTVVGNAVREFEVLRLTARGDTLVYTAIPSGQRETDFLSVSATSTELVFENLAHDFPQRVIYRRIGTDSVVARVEGPGPNNTTRGFDLPMRRASCTTPPATPSAPETLGKAHRRVSDQTSAVRCLLHRRPGVYARSAAPRQRRSSTPSGSGLQWRHRVLASELRLVLDVGPVDRSVTLLALRELGPQLDIGRVPLGAHAAGGNRHTHRASGLAIVRAILKTAFAKARADLGEAGVN